MKKTSDPSANAPLWINRSAGHRTGYYAFPVGLSNVLYILKREIGLEVETKFYPGNPITGARAYGVYFLTSTLPAAPDRRVA